MLYQLSYASKVLDQSSPFSGTRHPYDPFLMSGTILKVIITAFCVQGEGSLVWAAHSCPPCPPLLLLISLQGAGRANFDSKGKISAAKVKTEGGGQECPPHIP
jgi:hypothetical protein